MQPIRIWFSKRGRAIYISHLDLMRAMSRAVRRAALPVWYTEGFNPHPYLSFALPLPLGQEGLREAMDLRLEQDMPPDEAARRFDGVLPEGIEILGAAQPWCGPGEIAAAEYEIALPCGNPEAWAVRARSLLESGALAAKKMGKQGHRKIEKEIALAPLIFHYDLLAGPGGIRLACTLAAGSERNLNPALLCEALGSQAPHITRTRLLRADGSAWE
ncbi:MAG: TIGR03936 family radical SAM-associated protein [Oscillospiraceae bacterium]|jgi:radical SAM-linked protein|nr:TIGR03936 family radical SAM-associated protein [Oscillospiraceae bacterium]